MRMRHKPNLEARMEKCSALMITAPEEHKARWRRDFPAYSKIFLEIGCGKGRFTLETARSMPDTLIIAIEKVRDAMITAMERVAADGAENVRFIDLDAAKLTDVFDRGEIDRIYLNFCDPWPKSRDAKFRLTSPGFLRLYADVLSPAGAVHFKTDNTPLFDWSMEQLKSENWRMTEVTHDLHASGPVGVMTDYEAKFYAEGLKINRLEASKTMTTKTTADGPVPRLHHAALADARGYQTSVEANREREE